MKKNILLLVAIVTIVSLHAQDASKVFSSTTIGWYGLDFRNAKMIGFGDESPHTIKDENFKVWNDVAMDLDLAKMFQKNTAFKYPNEIHKLNIARETKALKATEDVDLTTEQITEFTKTVPVGLKKEGLGLVFIVQSFNKTTEIATVHVTFFDIATHAVLWTKKMTAKPSGGDSKKAWVGAIKSMFSQIEKTEFKNWRKEANY